MAKSNCDLLLIDGRNLVYRSGHVFRDLTAKVKNEDVPIGVVYGFLRMAVSIHQKWGGVPVVCWECPLKKNWRRKLYPSYKKKPDVDEDYMLWLESLAEQQRVLEKVLKYLGVLQAQAPNGEADDVIATLARRHGRKGKRVIIYTCDADLYPLITDNTLLVKTTTKGDIEYNRTAILAEFGVEPEKLYDVKSLSGCSGDGVPGVKGIGQKTALELIKTFGGIDEVVEAAKKGEIEGRLKRFNEKIIEHLEVVELAKQLITLRDVSVKYFEVDRNPIMVRRQFVKLGMKSFLKSENFGKLLALGSDS